MDIICANNLPALCRNGRRRRLLANILQENDQMSFIYQCAMFINMNYVTQANQWSLCISVQMGEGLGHHFYHCINRTDSSPCRDLSSCW